MLARDLSLALISEISGLSIKEIKDLDKMSKSHGI
jgi:hypothetical protein